MRGREFLELARELLASGTAPRHWRAVIIHAYYALFLECRDAMSRSGLPPLGRQQVHTEVRLRLTYSKDPDLKEIGNKLERLRRRNSSSGHRRTRVAGGGGPMARVLAKPPDLATDLLHRPGKPAGVE